MSGARVEPAPRPSLEEQVTANIRAGRYAAGVSASQLESIVLEAAREGRAEGYAEGLEKGRSEGFSQGREEGLVAARRIIEDQIARLGTLVEALPKAERREELARMLAGERVTEAARAAADSLLTGGLL
jgi:flagellar biosynthesis/type III secretory pathway protein FliH